MDDLDFVLFVSYIYQNREFSSFKQTIDEIIDPLNNMLIEHKHLVDKKHVDPNYEFIVDFSNEEVSRIIDVLNIYNPSIPLKFVLWNQNDNLITKRLKINSFRKIHYDINGDWVFDLGCIHGGKIVIGGSVNFFSIMGLIKQVDPKILMRTSINVDGEMKNIDADYIHTLFDKLVQIVGFNRDDDMVGFELGYPESIPQLEERKYYIRSWLIQIENTNMFKISVVRIHNLP